jgi:hypothetical protein
MSDWRIGDLAVFIGPSDPDDASRGMVIGRCYTVSAHLIASCGEPVLLFAEGIDPSPWTGWKPECFRKIRSCEPEFVQLLKRSKQRIEAYDPFGPLGIAAE